MPGERLLALETLNLLRYATPVFDDGHLTAASNICFPLGPIGEVACTPRFKTSFAIETLIKSIVYRENANLIARRLAHALQLAHDWLQDES